MADFTLQDLVNTDAFKAAAARLQDKYTIKDGPKKGGFNIEALGADLPFTTGVSLGFSGYDKDADLNNAKNVAEKIKLILTKHYVTIADKLTPDLAKQQLLALDADDNKGKNVFMDTEINAMIAQAQQKQQGPQVAKAEPKPIAAAAPVTKIAPVVTIEKPVATKTQTKSSPTLSANDSAFVKTVLTIATADPSGKGVAPITGVNTANNGLSVSMQLSDGKTHYFKQYNSVAANSSPTHFQAASWVETDNKGNNLAKNGKSDLYFCYSGYNANDTSAAQQNALDAVGHGKLNPQTPEVADFVRSTINKFGADKVAAIHIGSDSLGTSNAEVGALVSTQMNIPTETLTLEQVGDSLAVNKIKEALINPQDDTEKALVASLQTNGATNGQLLDAFNKSTSQTNNTAIQAMQIDSATGKVKLSNAAMLQLNSSISEGSNAETALNGRDGNIDPSNTPVGKHFYLDLSGRTNVAPADSAAGQNDWLHSLTNVASALQAQAPLTLAENVKNTPVVSPAGAQQETIIPPNAVNDNRITLDQVLESDTKFADFIKIDLRKKFMNSGTDQVANAPSAKLSEEDKKVMGEFISSLDKDPQRLKPLADLYDQNGNFRDFASNILNNAQSQGAKLSVTNLTQQLNALMDIAAKPGGTDILSNAAYIGNHALAYAKDHPEQTGIKQLFSGSGNLDVSMLTKENIDKYMPLVGDLDILTAHPNCAAVVDQGIQQYLADPKNAGKSLADSNNDLIQKLSDPAKFGAFLDGAEPLLADHPEFGKLLVDNFDPTKAADPKTTDLFNKIYDHPEVLPLLNKEMKTNKDLEAILTGKFDDSLFKNFSISDLGASAIQSFINPVGAVANAGEGIADTYNAAKAFLERNPTILTMLDDPTLNSLFTGSKMAADHPQLAKMMEKETVKRALTLFGYQKEDDNIDHSQEPMGYLCTILSMIVKIFQLDESSPFVQKATELAKMGDAAGVGAGSLLSNMLGA